MGWSNPLKKPLSEVAYSVQAFDWSGGKETKTTQDIPSLLKGGFKQYRETPLQADVLHLDI